MTGKTGSVKNTLFSMRKHYSFKKVTALFASCVLSSSLLLAIPARKGVQQYTQPDGKIISIVLHGDENFNYRTTTDGYAVVMNEQGYYVFAQVNNEGVFIPSALKAEDPQSRSELTKTALLNIETSQNVTARSRVRKHVEEKPRKTVSDVSKAAGTHGKCIIILAQFSDHPFIIPDTKQEFSNMLNQPGYSNKYGQAGSAFDFYKDNSMGKFTPEFTVIGPVTLPRTMSYYGGNSIYGDDMNPAQMALDAVNQAKSELSKLDLTQYDNNSDGEMDNIFIYYAGNNEAEGGPAYSVWPHAWAIQYAGLTPPIINNVKINTYACSSELSGTGRNMAGIGTFVHEFGHILGLPDMYDSDYNGSGGDSFALDCWSTMSAGSYNGNGYVPAGYTAYERMFCGWLTPQELNAPQMASLQSLQSSNEAYIIKSEKANEYFMLENRQLEGWDRELPQSGMLIYHIDYNESVWRSNKVNANPNHQYVDLEAADNAKVIYTGANKAAYLSSLKGDPYPGVTNKTEFNDNTKPGSVLWNGSNLKKPVTRIKETNKIITFSFMGASDVNAPANIMASEVNDNDFTITWDAVANADKYYLDVFSYEGIRETLVTESFGFSNPLIPDGFSSNVLNIYSSNSNFGKASPSLKFDNTYIYLQTKIFAEPIHSFSFWVKGQSLSGSTLLVEGFDGKNWNIIEEFVPKNTPEIKTYSPEVLSENTISLKFTYKKISGNLAFDDLEVSIMETAPSKVYVEGYQHKDLGNVLSAKVEGLLSNKEYTVQLKSAKSDVISPLSEEYKVTTTNLVGIDNADSHIHVFAAKDKSVVINNNSHEYVMIEVYDVMGKCVRKETVPSGKSVINIPEKGIYIVKSGNRTTKIIL